MPEQQSCFVMMPIKSRIEPVFTKAIHPAVEACGLECVRADKMVGLGPIEAQIRQAIESATVCIAELTDLNANVIYEVALAHAAGKPVVILTQESPESLPFDFRHLRAFEYDAGELETTRNTLVTVIQSVLASPDSPACYLEEMLLPCSLGHRDGPFVVATNPLTWREAAKVDGGFEKLRHTCSDHFGIRGLIQAFGLIYGLDRLPDLLNPGDYDDDVVKKNPMHVYCIGSPKANRWTDLLLHDFYRQWQPRLEFKADPASTDLRNIRVMVHCDGRLYKPPGLSDNVDAFEKDFGLVIRGPHPGDPEHMLMVLAGRSSLGTEAACRAATVPAHIQDIKDRLAHEHAQLNDHRKAFWAVVMMERDMDPRGTYEAIVSSFKVVEVHAFERL